MSARVLIIEDNPANLELMRYLLEAHGYTTILSENGQEALKVAPRELPDLIICDLQMPGMDGFAVVSRLKKSGVLRDIPVVAVTAYAMAGDRERVLSAGFDGYVSKPITPETFVQELAAFLPPALRSKAPPTPAQPVVERPSQHTVLVVDDMAVNLELWHSLLGKSGFNLVVASGMREALHQARRVVPDLILSDVCMNDGSGYDLIRDIKSDPRLRAIPFVFITSTMSDEAARAKGMALGAARFLFRPIEPQVLLDEINNCLHEHESGQTPGSDGAAQGHSTIRRRTILVMDDRAENLMLMQLLLERAGFTVFVATNLAQARSRLRQSGADLVLSDVNMPQDDGFTLLSEIRADPALLAMPFAFVSASEWSAAVRDKALRLGANRFFVQTPDAANLLSEIEGCLSAGS